jgi:hypothetical protein
VTATDPVADDADRRLDPRWIQCQRAQAWILTTIIAAGSFVAAIAAWATSGMLVLGLVFLPLWLIGVALLAWLQQRWPAIAYRFASYRIDDRGLEIRQGVYWRKITSVPRSRVQHTDVSQGPLERRYGLGTLVVHTAGTEDSKVDLAGLDYEVAQAIRANLLPRDNGDAV